MKKSLLIFVFFFAHSTFGQQRLTTDNGMVSFEASIPFFEAVKAKNNALVCTLKPTKGQISFIVTISLFEFKRSLMRDHFNAYYLESRRYPKATFKGVIEKFNMTELDSNKTTFRINGKITIHGKSKDITVNATLKKSTQWT